MEIMQTIGTILFALSALGFLVLAVYDKPRQQRERIHANPEVELALATAAQPRMLRAILVKLKSAAGRDDAAADRGDIRRSPERHRDLEKVA